jgi:hypothetical protein
MGMVPDAVGVISWIPGTVVSRAILDVGFSDIAPFAVNVVHPRPTKWSVVMRQVVDSLVEQGRVEPGKVKIVPWSDWVKELERLANKLDDVKSFENIVGSLFFSESTLALRPLLVACYQADLLLSWYGRCGCCPSTGRWV